MLEQPLEFLVDNPDSTRPLHAVRPSGLAGFLDALPPAQSRFLRQLDFAAAAQELQFLPGDDGVVGAVLGLGDDTSPAAFGNLAFRLPEGTPWRLQPGDYDPSTATLGFCLGAYRYSALKAPKRSPARLAAPDGQRRSRSAAAATWMVRDLVNTPANLLGPAELAQFTASLGKRYNAATEIIAGDPLTEAYPTVAAVGRGSARPAHVAILRWSGSTAHANAPLISLCGKGVCFDTGGYDIKPSSGMLRMKKDMGGAATVLGLARMIMQADLPVRLVVRIGCVENSISGTAMRPLDVIRTRNGATVEVGNTDAEGRLVLCDLLAESCDESPTLLVDCATLTGAARVALGPDLPALFCNDDHWAESLLRNGREQHDPLWRLPLWAPYDRWLDSQIADFNNISSKPHAGAITAALFLQRFVTPGIVWAHVDLYAWNDQTSPGHPEGGEAYGMRAMFAAITARAEGTRPD
jgi:leucyl aminopeptidase